jgi:iron complex transport system ATP-binding protein
MTSPALEIDGLEVRYGARVAVRRLCVTLAAGDLVALVGPNGAGKSSLLKAIAALLPHAGTVRWDGVVLGGLHPRARARLVAYLAQSPTLHWPMIAKDLVGLGRLPHRGYGSAPTEADREATSWALAQTEASALAERSVERLSVGERARILLARALAVRAPVLLVDEPIAMLDPYHQLQIMTVLRAYARGGPEGFRPPAYDDRSDGPQSALVIAVLHDLALAARFCTRVLLLDEGALVNDGAPAQALSAAALERHYRVEPLVTSHEGEPVIVPWRRIR